MTNFYRPKFTSYYQFYFYDISDYITNQKYRQIKNFLYIKQNQDPRQWMIQRNKGSPEDVVIFISKPLLLSGV